MLIIRSLMLFALTCFIIYWAGYYISFKVDLSNLGEAFLNVVFWLIDFYDTIKDLIFRGPFIYGIPFRDYCFSPVILLGVLYFISILGFILVLFYILGFL